MKRSMRGRRALSPLLLATTLPATGLTLLGISGPAQAYSVKHTIEAIDVNTGSVVNTGGVSASSTASTSFQPVQASPVEQKPPVQTAPPANPNEPVISEIIVSGAKTLSKTYIIVASGHNIGDPCTADVLSDMTTRLYATGYFGGHSVNREDAVRVTALEKEKGKCQVTIELDENTTITGIELTGTGPIKPEDVLPLIHLKPGTAYNSQLFLLDALDIEKLYSNKGYIATLAESSTIEENGTLNVTLIVTRVAEIKISGNRKTRRSVILRTMNTKVGDYLNVKTLHQDQIDLLNLGLFEQGGVNPSENPIAAGRVSITINVTEKRSGTVTAGVGYSNRAQLIGFAEVVESNYRGLGESVNVRGEVGGVSGRPSIETGFTEPYLDKKHTALNVQVYDKTVYRFANSFSNSISTQSTTGGSRYNEQRIGTTLSVSRPLDKRRTYRAAVSLRAEDVQTDPLDLSEQNAQIIQDGPIFVLGGQLVHNTRDLDNDAISGVLQTMNLQVGHATLSSPRTFTGITIPGVTGSVNFSKIQLETRQYFSLSGPRPRDKPDQQKTSLASRIQFGSSAGTLPFFEQFFVGGADTLRGYREDRFWGANSFLASGEFRQPLARQLKGVLFIDVGDAWGGDYTNVSIPGFTQDGFHPHVGVGLGIRVNTPIGPLRLDYGIGDEGGQTYFSIGSTY